MIKEEDFDTRRDRIEEQTSLRCSMGQISKEFDRRPRQYRDIIVLIMKVGANIHEQLGYDSFNQLARCIHCSVCQLQNTLRILEIKLRANPNIKCVSVSCILFHSCFLPCLPQVRSNSYLRFPVVDYFIK